MKYFLPTEVGPHPDKPWIVSRRLSCDPREGKVHVVEILDPRVSGCPDADKLDRCIVQMGRPIEYDEALELIRAAEGN